MSTSHRFHLIGIGGAGMSVVAELLKDRGLEVSGSDQKESPILDHLRDAGIEVFVGHDAAHVPADAVVVVSTAVRESNPELAEARRRGQSVIHRSQALALAASGMRFVAVAGAHGKTTTSAMLSMALRDAGEDPSIAVGAVIPQLGSGAYLGSGDVFVAEADESDGSFLNYTPWIEIVTNVEPDHLDRYGSREAFEQVFVDFVGCLRQGGTLVCCGEDDGSARLARYARTQGIDTVTYARSGHESADLGGSADVIIEEAHTDGHTASALLAWGDVKAEIHLTVPGIHNLLNACAAWIAGVRLGTDAQTMAHSLAAFAGTSRRFEFKGQVGTRRLFDDYAHHPSEIKATLSAAKFLNPNRLVAIFQPHTYTRTKSLLEEFATSFYDADIVIITDIYASRETDTGLVSSQDLVNRLKAHGKDAIHLNDITELQNYLDPILQKNDIIFTIGAGDVYKLGEQLLLKNMK